VTKICLKINPESVALVTQLRLLFVFFVVSQRQKKGAEEEPEIMS